ncbi:hypothetical protein [Streptomyces canus]|uniref:hypothetical protein n=1 Tax=Streptomyces canus TaxID=58343 RepID=UPI00131AABD8|nr:hypothetical protein [Streptomyces canus]
MADQEAQVVGYAYAARMPTLFGGTILELAVDTPVSPRPVRARHAQDVEITVPTRRAADFYRRLDFTETATYLKWPSPPPPPESSAPAR